MGYIRRPDLLTVDKIRALDVGTIPERSSRYAAALATNLARIAPGDLDVVQLYGTASQPAEAAVQLALRAQGPRRPGVAYAARPSDHRLGSDEVQVPFGDAGALADALRSPRIGAVLLETVPGGAGVVLPPPGYLREVRRLCDEYGVLWIADEARCGAGRTGRFFAFEHEGVVPDLVVVATSPGVDPAAVGAVIARGAVHRRAGPDTASALALGAGMLGGSGSGSGSGSGEACAMALEALTVLYDDDLIGNAERTGRYLLRRLEGLRIGYPDLVVDVRGMGLVLGVQLAGLSAGTPETLRLEPPLTIQPEQVDEFVDELDELLSRRPRRLVLDCLHLVRGWWPGSSPIDPVPTTRRW